jgi:hypothetical protein
MEHLMTKLRNMMKIQPAGFVPRIGIAVVLLLALTSLSCGGGGGGSGIPTPSLSATFTPATTNPSGSAVFMSAGATSGAVFTIQVNAANVTDLFGAGFRVLYDPAVIGYVGSDSSASVLLGSGVQTDFSVTVSSPGTLFVTATRIQANPFVPGVDVTTPAELISLTFQALLSTGGSTLSFSSQQVDTCDDVAETCTTLTAAWSGGSVTAN